VPGRSRVVLAFVAAATLLPAPVLVVAADDTTPPVGSVSVVHDDRDAELIRLSVTATDDQSGVSTIEVSGNGTTWASFPYAPQVDWAVFDPASGGSDHLGNRTVRVRWTDGVGNTSVPMTTTLYLSRNGALEYPKAPVTGQLFTIRPIYGPGVIPPAGENCSWEIRWGNEKALRENLPNETFGDIFLSGKPDRGFCGPWTFTVPWVPVRQFEVYFSSLVMSTEDDTWAQRAKFYPTVGSTDQRIYSSNLPMVHILPDKYETAVGVPITYTAYPIGTTLRNDDTWVATCPDFNCRGLADGIGYKIKYGGAKFTFTPPFAGTWLIGWTGRFRPYTLGAAYDPKARKPDRTDPTTTPPVQKITGGTPGTTVPVTLEWSGSDVGWGIEKFRLQRSTDGGPWTSIGLPTPKAKSIVQHLTPGHSYRYRVRAVDKAGNAGAWDEGPSFKPKLISDASTRITYHQPWFVEADATAIGGGLHHSSTAGASATFKFKGRDVAWIAERGPLKGRVKVYVDGVLQSTVDLGAAADGARSIVFRRHWSSVGSHVIKLVVEGTAGRPMGTLDAFAVLR
jgi:hypothetical protein